MACVRVDGTWPSRPKNVRSTSSERTSNGEPSGKNMAEILSKRHHCDVFVMSRYIGITMMSTRHHHDIITTSSRLRRMTDGTGRDDGRMHRRAAVWTTGLLAFGSTLGAACGSSDPGATPRDTVASALPTSGDATIPPTVPPSPTISTISVGAEATEPARRNTVEVAWIAGSDSVWNDVDLPAEVAERVPVTPAWNLEITSTIRIAPVATDITASINEAVAAGADALVIPMNISWLNWKEPACLDMDIHQPYERYACILTSLSPQIDAANAAALTEMIATVVASELPSLMYAIPHSTNALADPVIGPMIDAAEERLATFDPNDPDVIYRAASFTRDGPPFVEGVDFIDMVHPTAVGAERLADWLAVQVAQVVADAQR